MLSSFAWTEIANLEVTQMALVVAGSFQVVEMSLLGRITLTELRAQQAVTALGQCLSTLIAPRQEG